MRAPGGEVSPIQLADDELPDVDGQADGRVALEPADVLRHLDNHPVRNPLGREKLQFGGRHGDLGDDHAV